MKRPLLLTPLALIALLIAAAPAKADDRQCTGSIGAVDVDANVIVPSGATCTLRGTRVDDNVFVRPGAVLEAFGVSVGGNIQAENHGRVVVGARTVNDAVVRSRIGGDIQLFDGDRGRVWQAVIGGNLQVKQNSGFQEASSNVIDGDLQAFSNRGGFRIDRNRIGGNLQCKSNDPPPYGGGNLVEGNREDQCSQLEPSPPDGTTPPPDTAEPKLLVGGPAAQRLGRTVEVRVSCDEPRDVGAAGKVVVRSGAKAGAAARRGARRLRVRLNPASASLAAGERKTLKLKLSKKKLRKVRRAMRAPGAKAKAKLKVSASDSAGNDATARRTVRLKR